MTRDEKINCLGTNPSVPRLGIKGTGHVEGLHGLALGGPGGWGRPTPIPTTQFAQAIGMGETWDPALIRQAGRVEGEETRYIFQSEKTHRGGLVVRAPNADLGSRSALGPHRRELRRGSLLQWHDGRGNGEGPARRRSALLAHGLADEAFPRQLE